MSANEPGQPSTASSEVTTNLSTPTVALAIGAHPDDIEFGCGATLAKWAADGCLVHHLVCTDGAKGTWDANADSAMLAQRRQAEQREAAQRLSLGNAGQVIFLEYVDGELESGLAARSRVAKAIRTLRPDVVLAHDPWKRYRLHPDHRHAGLLACDAVVAARDPHFFPEHGIAHHRPNSLLLWEAEEVDHIENVDRWVSTKIHALEAHESQFESTMKASDDSQLAGFRNRIEERLSGLGKPYGFASAEVFKLISDL